MKQRKNASPASSAIEAEEFASLMEPLEPQTGKKFAVAVSGGIDSMALAFLLHNRARQTGRKQYALIVDHGLRKASAKEAAAVSKALGKLGIENEVLKWRGKKPQTAVQEIAREKRYELLLSWCKKNKIKTLFLAHHLDDQAETFFQRLIRGSGVRGLSCMPQVSEREGITIIRPLLSVSKERLKASLVQNKITWFEDETNSTDKYQRNRVRRIISALEPEGFTVSRLSGTISALSEANQALGHYAEMAFEDCIEVKPARALGGKDAGWGESTTFLLCVEKLSHYPRETIRRVIARVLYEAGNGEEIRREKLEPFMEWVLCGKGKARTLGGAIAERKKEIILFCKERVRAN